VLPLAGPHGLLALVGPLSSATHHWDPTTRLAASHALDALTDTLHAAGVEVGEGGAAAVAAAAPTAATTATDLASLGDHAGAHGASPPLVTRGPPSSDSTALPPALPHGPTGVPMLYVCVGVGVYACVACQCCTFVRGLVWVLVCVHAWVNVLLLLLMIPVVGRDCFYLLLADRPYRHTTAFFSPSSPSHFLMHLSCVRDTGSPWSGGSGSTLHDSVKVQQPFARMGAGDEAAVGCSSSSSSSSCSLSVSGSKVVAVGSVPLSPHVM
jgi:hypothetical protein